MKAKLYKVKSKIWLYPGMAGWHFVSIDKKQSEEIKKKFGSMKRGWGSLPAVVTLGKTVWRTSIFPDTKAGAYLLPLKAEVRKKEGVYADESISFSIEIRA
ncbi:MAG: DUF1905 domain-containing protein [Candidatus Pacebacteria bacterium]|nr:DUF1905 domain-containing protein [Candidatus Paceibacterota bacterium]MBP9832598.1 DUF1905 domain-containing protein [Candidatus Paceibacterota bacterium]